jgi:hypothetical protein
VSKPTITLGSSILGRDASSSASPTGLSFAAQPQVLAKLVRVDFRNIFDIFITTFLVDGTVWDCR